MSPRVLVIDDEDAIRTIAAISLERVGGWTVVDARSGQEGLGALQGDGPFDAVLMDVMMPGLDGPTTLARMREETLGTQVPVVFMTAKAGEGERRRLLEQGAAGVIAKPFDPMNLDQQLRDILSSSGGAAE